MKPVLITLTAFMLLFGIACNSNKSESASSEKKDMDTMAKAEEVMPAPPPAPVKPYDILVIWHKVTNFDKWLKAFEADDSAREANGLHKYIIGRDASNPNNVFVAMKMDNVDKAKAFSSSPDLKKTMQKAGVVGPPTIAMINIQSRDTSSNAIPNRVMISHKVKDYDTWKKEFDSHKQIRMDAGLIDRVVGYSFEDKNQVFVFCAAKDEKKAKAFFNSKDLKDKMTAAGVEGPPTIRFFTVAKHW